MECLRKENWVFVGKRLRERVLEGSPLQETVAAMEFDGFSDDDDDDDDGDDISNLSGFDPLTSPGNWVMG